MITTNTILPASERKKIETLVSTFENKSVPELVVMLHKLLNTSLTTAHYIYLGAVIGSRVATLKRNAININNLTLCQRQN